MTKGLDPTDPRRQEVLWRTAVEDLRTELPLDYPVRVQRREVKDAWGLATFIPDKDGEGRFAITVAPHQSFNFMLDVLVHEWAHILDWFSTHEPGVDHGDTWGIWYARAYRVVFGQ